MKDMENSSSGMAHYYPVETVISCCGMARYSPVDMESETTMNLSKKVGDPRQDSKRKIVIALCSTCVLTIFAISLIFGLAFSKTQDTKPNEIKLPNKTQDVQFPRNQTKINIPFPSKKFTIDATLILKETAYFDVYIQRNNGKPHHYGHECSELHCFIKMQVRIPCTPDDNVTMTIEPKKSLVSVEKLTVDFTPMRNNTNE